MLCKGMLPEGRRKQNIRNQCQQLELDFSLVFERTMLQYLCWVQVHQPVHHSNRQRSPLSATCGNVISHNVSVSKIHPQHKTAPSVVSEPRWSQDSYQRAQTRNRHKQGRLPVTSLKRCPALVRSCTQLHEPLFPTAASVARSTKPDFLFF